MKFFKVLGSILAVIFCTCLFALELIIHSYIILDKAFTSTGVKKITNSVSIVDLFNDKSGKKTHLYYKVQQEFKIKQELFDTIINSKLVNDSVSDIITKSTANKKNNKQIKISNQELVKIVDNNLKTKDYGYSIDDKAKIHTFVVKNATKLIKYMYSFEGDNNE